jgi:hypothetical protein
MPIVHTRYVTYISAGRRRHPGSAAKDITDPFDNTVNGPSVYHDWANPQATWTDEMGKLQSARFAFWSVTGGADGAFVSRDAALSVPVGDDPIMVTAWYLPEGVGGPGDPTTYIDAFDIDLGDFFDDDFVSVAPDTGLTFNANELGLVPTAAQETIQAYAGIGGRVLEDWQILEVTPAGADTASGPNLSTAAKSGAVAFAFYKRPHSGGLRLDDRQYRVGTWVSFGVTVDGGGPTGNGPVPPWEPLIRELAASLSMAYVARQGGVETRTEATALAAKQLTATATKIGKAMVEEAKLGAERLRR